MDSLPLLGLSEGCETWVDVRMEPCMVEEEKTKIKVLTDKGKWKRLFTQGLARAQP